MNKESIYKIIGYQGEYNDSVKKALKKLLKENHPDLHGNAQIFQLINEVKKELTNNQVSFKYEKKTKKYTDIDYDFCQEMVDKLTKKKNRLTNSLEILQNDLDDFEKSYSKLYYQRIEKQHVLLDNNIDSMKLKRIKIGCIIFLIVIICTFFLAFYQNNLFGFCLFGMMVFLFFWMIKYFFYVVQDITKKSKVKAEDYVKVINNISKINKEKEEKTKEILKLKREIDCLENDLRFYHNILK